MNSISGTATRTDRRAGFTLLEIIVVIAVLSILAGAAVPVAARVMQAAARKATRAEVETLSQAALEFFRDTGSPPRSIADLEQDPNQTYARGWAGPYLSGAIPDGLTSQSGYRVDAWSRDYRFANAGVLSIASAGEGGVLGDEDDIAIDVDFTPIRREKTIERLRTVNQAILLYNSVYQTSAPLSAEYATALAKLVEKSFLPDSSDYRTDAWGEEFVADPPGKTPLVRIGSTALSATKAGAKSGKSKKSGKGS